jgi:hypothetical protein
MPMILGVLLGFFWLWLVLQGWIYFIAWCVRQATLRGLLP